jgi:hypothetical protein
MRVKYTFRKRYDVSLSLFDCPLTEGDFSPVTAEQDFLAKYSTGKDYFVMFEDNAWMDFFELDT